MNAKRLYKMALMGAGVLGIFGNPANGGAVSYHWEPAADSPPAWGWCDYDEERNVVEGTGFYISGMEYVGLDVTATNFPYGHLVLTGTVYDLATGWPGGWSPALAPAGSENYFVGLVVVGVEAWGNWVAPWAGPTLTISRDRKVSFYGLYYKSYQLEKSSDLTTWNPTGPAISGADRHEVLDLGAPTGGPEFWRLHVQ